MKTKKPIKAKYEFKNVSEVRSRTMRAIKGRNTGIELALRKELWRNGIRGYRVNYNKIIGKPDIAFVGKKIAIFCDSEFWHGKDWEIKKEKIKTRKDYWIPKIYSNIERDKLVTAKLKRAGWSVLRFWDSEIRMDINAITKKIIKKIGFREKHFTLLGSSPKK
ncbi:MAG: very short patch repair endonuclease [Lentisphaerota bacterium]